MKSKALSTLTVIVALTFFAPGVGFAQNADLQVNERSLTTIESLFTRMESAKTSDDKDKVADEFESRLSAYAKSMMDSFTSALRQTETFAKSQGKDGNVGSLKAFEDLAVKHESRMKQLDGRGQKLAPRSGFLTIPEEGAAHTLAMFRGIGDFIISPAAAAIAASVYVSCHQTPMNQGACQQAVTSGNGQASVANATYSNCWNGLEGVRPKWVRAVRRSTCVSTLVARLA